jgi:hypothetical protein
MECQFSDANSLAHGVYAEGLVRLWLDGDQVHIFR